MSWIRVNGKWQEKSKLKKSNKIEQTKLETQRNNIIKEIKDTSKNTKIPKLRKSVDKLAKVQNNINKLKENEKKLHVL